MRKVQRTFFPGSQWVYLKIYTGHKTADHLLCRHIFNLVRQMKRKNYILKWFFIRYDDPDHHLRVRFLSVTPDIVGEIIAMIYTYFRKTSEEKQVYRIQLDTYNRELERYGHELIEQAESIFYVDSECTLLLIKRLSILKNEHLRWRISLKMIDVFLSDFSYTLSEKKELMERISDSYKQEFGFNKHNSKQFNTKFREFKNQIELLLNGNEKDPDLLSLTWCLEERSQQLIPIISKLKAKAGKKQVSLSPLMPSYIHMMMNRLFRSKNRQYELVLYDFMRRYYTSELTKKSLVKKL